MEWNLKINGEEVRWKISDTVAVVPRANILFPGYEAKPRIGKSPESSDDASQREQRDLRTFRRAGWEFIQQTESDGSATRQVFIDERGGVLIETDIATVQLNSGVLTKRQRAKEVLARDELIIVEKLKFAPNLYVVRLPSGRPLRETIYSLQANTERYVFAEPSMLQRISGRQDPTDPDFAKQWQHSAQNGLHSVAAWTRTKGIINQVSPPRPVRIAIIDNGMEVNHTELRTGIIGGGYFKPNGSAAMPDFVRYHDGMSGFPDWGHGTGCMGMAGARENNGNGGCGIAPECDLLAIACAPDQVGTQLTLARSIDFAITPQNVDPQGDLAFGADVISCSLATANDVESVLRLAIDSATSGRGELGIPVFWAVDNDDTQISADKLCSLKNVIAVGRSDRYGEVYKCARGPKLEFLAPGVNVLGPSILNKNIKWSGTSFATPLAAGVAALVLSRNPDWTADQVLQHLRDTCWMPSHPPADDDRYGHGILNAEDAVQ